MTAIQTGEKRTARESGIELLKIAAIFLIVISHVVQTLSSQNDFLTVNDYVLKISSATTDVKTLFLAFLRFSGNLGNTIFFVCSAWFLLDSRKTSKKKVLNMILDVWLVSVVIFSIVYFMRGGNVSAKLIIKSFLPTTFGNNWYITCYVIFYVMHPVLNGVIRSMNQNTLLASCTFLSFLYILCNFVRGGGILRFGDHYMGHAVLCDGVYEAVS